jgi:predicted nuclease of restriction endonuclease-like RecB superfamily
VLIPDFSFHKDGRTALLEIVGVWRKGYLERRLELLRRHGRPDLILAVSRSLLGDKGTAAADLGAEVVPWKSAIPAKKVLELVERVAR